MAKDLRKMLFERNPKLKEKIESEQYRLSNILLDKRFEHNKSYEEMCEIAGVSFKDYIRLEYGDVDVPVEEYERAIKNIGEYEAKERILSYLKREYDSGKFERGSILGTISDMLNDLFSPDNPQTCGLMEDYHDSGREHHWEILNELVQYCKEEEVD